MKHWVVFLSFVLVSVLSLMFNNSIVSVEEKIFRNMLQSLKFLIVFNRFSKEEGYTVHQYIQGGFFFKLTVLRDLCRSNYQQQSHQILYGDY